MAADASGIGQIHYAAVVVRDLDRAMERYTNELGIKPWAVYTFTPDWVRDMTFRGKEQDFAFKIALCEVAPITHELLEPVQGPNSYEEFLNERGEGLHHLCYLVEDIDAEISRMESRGFALLQSGRGFGTNDDGAYAQFDTERTLGCTLEALELPPEMQPPERTYPEQS
jgi:methylmalonyl-CoA/ethylmalonyl-CoA epimerase